MRPLRIAACALLVLLVVAGPAASSSIPPSGPAAFVPLRAAGDLGPVAVEMPWFACSP